MFSFFKSKEQKLVKKWEEEHLKIVEIAGEVITAYTAGKTVQAKRKIRELGELTSSHIMNEDIEFFKLSKQKKLDNNTIRGIKEFQETFKKVKLDLMSFLSIYGKDETKLDQEFFEKFNEILDIVGKRIIFEENNLYELLKEK